VHGGNERRSIAIRDCKAAGEFYKRVETLVLAWSNIDIEIEVEYGAHGRPVWEKSSRSGRDGMPLSG
jgi:hypothetical protein